MKPRSLPAGQPRWTRDVDVVVAGAGAAGLTTAVTLAEHGRRVLLIRKSVSGSTVLAQGGMAAVLSPDDSLDLHATDTQAAGAGWCDDGAVSSLVAGAPGVVAWLESLGARFGRGHLEGGHSRPRIVHALSGGDAIGAEVHRVLTEALLASRVEVLDDAVALDLVPGGLTMGLGSSALQPGTALSAGVVRAGAVVLATGGFGQAYATTTNPAGATGDGLALAVRAGAAVRDLEFVQFHPTVLWSADARGQCPLITEAVRGAGAIVVDRSGRQVCDPLAPRDVVAAAMHASMTKDRVPHLWLDARPVPGFRAAFPVVWSTLRARGIDPATDLIPVAPGAHYACGGIAADFSGRTSVPGLFAVGEVACTGVHGANRLASNSLTEALLMGRRAGALLGRQLPSSGVVPACLPRSGRAGTDPGTRDRMAAAMSRYAGVSRSGAGLSALVRELRAADAGDILDLATVEATNLHTVSMLVATAALARRESRGCHRRSDVARAA